METLYICIDESGVPGVLAIVLPSPDAGLDLTVTVPKIFLSQLAKTSLEGGDIRITFLTTIGIERKGLRFADARKTNQPTQADYVRGRFDPLPISSMVDEFLNRRMYYCSGTPSRSTIR